MVLAVALAVVLATVLAVVFAVVLGMVHAVALAVVLAVLAPGPDSPVFAACMSSLRRLSAVDFDLKKRTDSTSFLFGGLVMICYIVI